MNRTKQSSFAPDPRARFETADAIVESLESRRLLSAAIPASISQGILHITGTNGPDNISLTLSVTNILTLKYNGSTKTFGKIYNTGIDHTEIMLFDGNDKVTVGLGVGNVYVNGGNGNDTVLSGNGNDTLTGAAGNDYLSGGAGRDRLNGLVGNDQLFGGRDVDRIFGGDGNDTITGDDGTDYLFGENGSDSMSGGAGNDSLDGGSNNDTLTGDAGDDTMFGGSGGDNLTGGSGHDTVFGNAGDDRLSLRDLESDLADGGTGTDWAVLDDFEKTFVVAEMKAY